MLITGVDHVSIVTGLIVEVLLILFFACNAHHEEIKLVVLTMLELCLAESISQLVSRKLHENLMEVFGVALKAFTMSKQYC